MSSPDDRAMTTRPHASTADPRATLRVDERLRLAIENVQDYAIFLLDPAGNVETWNLGAQRLKGYTAAEIVGRSFQVFYPPEAVARDWPNE
jgi:PAS domain S-box-containing protein